MVKERHEQQVLMTNNQEENHKTILEEKKSIREAQEAIKHHEPPIISSSLSSSPSHEFSFTVPLHPPPPPENQPPPAVDDFSPADEIFFHGHLLPLHFLSNFPTVISPRSSTNSLDSFTLPIKELSQGISRSFHHHHDDDQHHLDTSFQERSILHDKGSGKSKSFSLFGLPRRRKEPCVAEKETKDGHQDHDKGKKRKSRFDIGHVMQRYMRLIKPFLSFRNNNIRREKKNIPHHGRQGYSLSCNNLRVKKEKVSLRGRRGELYSAPVSMITSPTNSGRLVVASGTATPAGTSDHSTMEELQAAIQAAIAHCKKSNNINAIEDKISQASIT